MVAARYVFPVLHGIASSLLKLLKGPLSFVGKMPITDLSALKIQELILIEC